MEGKINLFHLYTQKLTINTLKLWIITVLLRITYGDSIVEQRLAKDDDVKDFIHMDLLEDGQNGHRINGWD